MCEKEQRAELGLSHVKRELRNHTHENQELQSWNNVHEKKSAGIGAATFLQRLRSPEIIHTVAGHIDEPE